MLIGLAWCLAAHGQTERLPAPTPLPASAAPAPRPPVLSGSEVLRWTLEHSPELATFRRQHGIAAAGIIIANTYPFNPFVQNFVWYGNGPANAGVTNHVFNEHTMRLDLEVRNQGSYRRALAAATLSRTDWEIAAQEVLMSIRVVRAFNNLLYRQQKYDIQEEVVRLQQETVNQVNLRVEQNLLPRADLILARADLVEARTLRGPGHALLVVAWNDLRRLMGVVDEPFTVEGTLERTLPPLEAPDLVRAGLERRPDLQALDVAVKEAEARMRLEVANRYGNPSVGPAFEYNETSVYFMGIWAFYPLPVFNQRRGEIAMRRAEQARAVAAARQVEVQIEQDVRAALARMADARKVVQSFRTEALPSLRDTRAALEKLYAGNQPGADLARVIEVRRRLLRVRDAYLDALWELSQAQADLAAAIGDPSLVVAPCPPAPPPAAAPSR